MSTDKALRDQIAEAIPVELTGTAAVGIGDARRLRIADAILPTVLARLAEVEAERDAADEFRTYYRDMAVERGKIMEEAEQALAMIALECVPFVGSNVTHVLSPAEIRDLAVARLAELEAARPVVEAAATWRAMVKAWGGPLRKVPGSIAGAEELIAAVDLYRSATTRNLDSDVPDPSLDAETLDPTTEEKP